VQTSAEFKKFFAASLPIIAMLLAALLSRPAFGQETDDWCDRDGWDNSRGHACEVREYRIDAGAIDLDAGTNGGVSVQAWDGHEVLVQAKVSAQARDDRAAEGLVEAITVATAGGKISADGPKNGRNESWGVSYRVFVPRATDLRLEAHNGGISVTGVNGTIRFSTDNGGVSLTDLAGDVRGETQNGGVNVRLAGSRWDGAGLDVETRNGGVKMSIPEGYNAELETGTVNGGVRVDFPVTLSGDIKRRLETTLGSGGPRVRVVTTNGGVTVGRANH
jgi:DUF4097 and DUF4098 domain-containing protein YvlB